MEDGRASGRHTAPETGAKNQGEPTASTGSCEVECLIIRPLCVNGGDMLGSRYPDTAGVTGLSAGRSFSWGGGAPLIARRGARGWDTDSDDKVTLNVLQPPTGMCRLMKVSHPVALQTGEPSWLPPTARVWSSKKLLGYWFNFFNETKQTSRASTVIVA